MSVMEMEQQPPVRVRRSFTEEFKRDAVSLVLDESRRIVDVASSLGIGDGTLGNWVLCRRRHKTQLRHTYATALVNAGVSLQALMALLGHVSAEMSLRYAHLFDATVRTEYERALNIAKTSIGPIATPTPAVDGHGYDASNDWRDAPVIKTRLAAGHCLRAPAQGACPYANICERCPSFSTNTASVAILSAQRADTETLAADAQTRGWIDETARHRKLVARLDTLIEQETA